MDTATIYLTRRKQSMELMNWLYDKISNNKKYVEAYKLHKESHLEIAESETNVSSYHTRMIMKQLAQKIQVGTYYNYEPRVRRMYLINTNQFLDFMKNHIEDLRERLNNLNNEEMYNQTGFAKIKFIKQSQAKTKNQKV